MECSHSPIKLLIADDNNDVCNTLSNFFNDVNDIKVCAITHDGISTVEQIKSLSPDIVLLDIVMPNADGIDVLRLLKQRNQQPMPQFIIISAVGSESVLKEAYSLGVKYYMLKPFILKSLEERIRKIYSNQCKEKILSTTSTTSNFKTDSIIKKHLIRIGIPTNSLGYLYITDALKNMINASQGYLISDIYETVAKNYETTQQCVEGAIRNAISRAHEKRSKDYSKIFSKSNGRGTVKPTNSQLLTKLAESIKISDEL